MLEWQNSRLQSKMESPVERASSRQSRDIAIARNVYDESFFTASKRHGSPLSSKEDSTKKSRYLNVVRRKLSPSSCSWSGFISVLTQLMPIIRWLPKYNFKEDLFPDLNGGVTVAVMHIPQGIAILYWCMDRLPSYVLTSSDWQNNTLRFSLATARINLYVMRSLWRRGHDLAVRLLCYSEELLSKYQ